MGQHGLKEEAGQPKHLCFPSIPPLIPFHPSPLLFSFEFLFLILDFSSSCWHSCKSVRLDSEHSHLCVCGCVFVQAIEAAEVGFVGERQIPLDCKSHSMCRLLSFCVLLSKENNHKTRVISLGDWVSYHTLKIKLLIFKMKEVFSTDSYALFRYRLLSFYPDIRSEGNQKNQKKTE